MVEAPKEDRYSLSFHDAIIREAWGALSERREMRESKTGRMIEITG